MLRKTSRLTCAAIAPLSFLWFGRGPELTLDAESKFILEVLVIARPSILGLDTNSNRIRNTKWCIPCSTVEGGGMTDHEAPQAKTQLTVVGRRGSTIHPLEIEVSREQFASDMVRK
jgi:hypothetical protein